MVLPLSVFAKNMCPWSCVWEPRGSEKDTRRPGPGLHFCEMQHKIMKDPDFLFKKEMFGRCLYVASF